jgi:hypothetical protein
MTGSGSGLRVDHFRGCSVARRVVIAPIGELIFRSRTTREFLMMLARPIARTNSTGNRI